MKRKYRILIISVVSAIALLLCSAVFLPRVGYSSPEKLMWLNPTVTCYEICGMLESNDRTLVLYKGKDSNKSEIVYEKNDRYYLFNYNTEPIVWKYINNGMVIVRFVDNKYTIEISGISGIQSINEVSDGLGTKFEYQLIDYGNSYTQQWFVALDEIPEDYYICVDNEVIYVEI